MIHENSLNAASYREHRLASGLVDTMNTVAPPCGVQEDEPTLTIETANADASLAQRAAWIGIPPLHHQMELWIPDTAEELARQTVSSAVHFPETRRRHRRTASPRSADCSWKNMPTHLRPFLPYIEKTMEETAISVLPHDARTMDVKIIRTWIDQCDQLHGKRCHGSGTSQMHSPFPSYLIDVQRGCLVAAPRNPQYVALSYVWGGAETAACATIANLAALQEHNGLYSGIISLPNLIRDAINLVNDLGLTHLWVDRIAIVQDDEATKHHQLSAMGEIYARGLFTLVAAQNEEAAMSLYGHRKMALTQDSSGTSQRFKNQNGTLLSGSQYMLEQAISLMETKWYSRGWTFQEYIFSTRRVIFQDHTVNWECLCDSWHECQDISTASSDPKSAATEIDSPVAVLNSSPWPDMIRYTRLMTLFNERDLTFPEDVLDAFISCLVHLSSVFPGGFTSGLPTMCFDAVLLWQPWAFLKRRKPRRVSDEEAMLPSWSWAGWEGIINSESWRSAANYQFESSPVLGISQYTSWRTLSTIQWTFSKTLESERYPINIPSQFRRPAFTQSGDSLPAGWSMSADLGEDGQAVRHSCDPSTPFRYPIPILDETTRRQPVINARYLHCTTKHAFLALGKEFLNTTSGCPSLQLLTVSGQWAGCLRLNFIPSHARDETSQSSTPTLKHRSRDTSKALPSFSFTTPLPSEVADALYDPDRMRDESCELIEISAGSVENWEIDARSFDEWYQEDCGWSQGLYEFVNVLWITRMKGVAYRKALGRVRKDVWEREAKERIAVTLG
jgi:hypothetical protein